MPECTLSRPDASSPPCLAGFPSNIARALLEEKLGRCNNGEVRGGGQAVDRGGPSGRGQRAQLALGGERLPRLVPLAAVFPAPGAHHPRRGGLSIRITTLDRLDGEAYVNVRKGKIIPGYELSLSLSFVADSPLAQLSGSVDVPYLADENAGEDPEIKVSVRGDDGPLASRVKEAFLAKGKPIVLEKIRTYVQAMANGGPAKDELEVKKPGKAAPSATTATAPPAKEKEGKGKDGFKTIRMAEKFHCRARDVYEILMDEKRWKGFTQSNARISKEVGGQFSLFDGSITGMNEELQDGKLIVQKWRFSSWADGIYSTVRLTFDEPEMGVTIVKLTQTDVPEEDRYGNATVVENTERGWRELILHRIRAVFGFGI